ncbi:regulator of microtubule dynamics protein 1-like [Uloborus diversus]|uniref:regulator of microtubule dynamics protein 1-like n=1 Tax=Uloborus diversus TaxID=327109 RepID=UPI0024093C47|nr:regulator of microtubule dynamics protein 1-like [Uloborus diversus]XP_054716620.1 regulator of microtubule dynamics protein 1-like [Uloborus diversus]
MARINVSFCVQAFYKQQRLTAVKLLRLQAVQVLNQCRTLPFAKQFGVTSLLSTLFIVKALNKSEKADHSTIIKEADVLYDNGHYDKLHEALLPHRSTDNPEILWRFARAIFEKCRNEEKTEKLKSLEESLSLVDRALELDETCWAAHKWRAILLDYVWRFKSTKGRIIHSFDVKKHMERAIELNPKDSTSYYLLGEWCFTFADMPWYQRKAAAAIFASPPTSTYEEALQFFEKAEQICPKFYSMNLLMIGKCYLKMKQEDKAILFLKQALEYPVKTPDDQQAHAEAEKLLKNLNAN